AKLSSLNKVSIEVIDDANMRVAQDIFAQKQSFSPNNKGTVAMVYSISKLFFVQCLFCVEQLLFSIIKDNTDHIIHSASTLSKTDFREKGICMSPVDIVAGIQIIQICQRLQPAIEMHRSHPLVVCIEIFSL